MRSALPRFSGELDARPSVRSSVVSVGRPVLRLRHGRFRHSNRRSIQRRLSGISSQVFSDLTDFSTKTFDDFTLGAEFSLTTLTVFGFEFGDASANIAVTAAITSTADFNAVPILTVGGNQVGEDLTFDFGGALLGPGSDFLQPSSPDRFPEEVSGSRKHVCPSQAAWPWFTIPAAVLGSGQAQYQLPPSQTRVRRTFGSS